MIIYYYMLEGGGEGTNFTEYLNILRMHLELQMRHVGWLMREVYGMKMWQVFIELLTEFKMYEEVRMIPTVCPEFRSCYLLLI